MRHELEFRSFSTNREDQLRIAPMIGTIIFLDINSPLTGIRKFFALIDTGAGISLINTRNIDTQSFIELQMPAIVSFTGAQQHTIRRLSVPIVFGNGGQLESLTFGAKEFADDANFDIIIGMDILHFCELNFVGAKGYLERPIKVEPENTRAG